MEEKGTTFTLVENDFPINRNHTVLVMLQKKENTGFCSDHDLAPETPHASLLGTLKQ